jgi:hypothetical protein
VSSASRLRLLLRLRLRRTHRPAARDCGANLRSSCAAQCATRGSSSAGLGADRPRLLGSTGGEKAAAARGWQKKLAAVAG